MKVELRPDSPLTDDSCKEATGKTLSEWIAAIEARPELKGKRRDTVNEWLYPEMGKSIWWATTTYVEFERRNGIVQKDGKIEGYNICVTKSIVATVPEVFAAWTQGTPSWIGDSASLADDKSFEDANGNKATALRIRENKDLRYRWQTAGSPDETQVEVTIADKGGGKTLITLMHNRIQTREESDGLRRAWGDAFNALKMQLESI
jgi:uncharacterized protein YndB with AHSA1/START domain